MFQARQFPIRLLTSGPQRQQLGEGKHHLAVIIRQCRHVTADGPIGVII